MKNINIDEDLLRVNLQGRANEKEKATLVSWLSESSENKELFVRMTELWSSASNIDVFEQIDLELDWKRIQMKRKKKTFGVTHILRYAAVVFISCSLSFLYLYNTTPGFGKLSKVQTTESKDKFELADGSQIQLNVNSKLIYPNHFGDNKRLVKLKGEAFFNIKRDTSKPFIIESGKTLIKVLGTSFNIRNMAGDQTLVSVNTGRVSFKIKNNDQELILTKGQVGLFKDNQLAIINKPGFNYDSWRTGFLSFKNTPFIQVLQDIERLYKVEIKNQNIELENLKLTIDFNNYDIDKVLKQLELLIQANIEKKGQVITIK
ncbi:FecR family protein [Ancylomarina salipaludis]|uniref:FecR family protein n=1 Tax=Ancylomarina salipaludis TaxID=2501299 RepID=A0A4Q1JIR8_9BACT|nr:FecR family protein [Ancylomarina salipaludis]RXQ89523.1 FecR family protein [Ancylomarina salipaludis]